MEPQVEGMSRGDRIRRARAIDREDGDEIADRYKAGERLVDIARDYSITEQTVAGIVRRRGGVVRKRGFGARDNNGPNNVAWQGGRHIKDGYVLVWISEDHPMAVMRTKRGYLPEHRLVMAMAISRALSPDETVHHIDGDGLNNTLENLQLRQGRHGRGSRWYCADCGSHSVVAGGL